MEYVLIAKLYNIKLLGEKKYNRYNCKYSVIF